MSRRHRVGSAVATWLVLGVSAASLQAATAPVVEPSPNDAHRIGICLACHSVESLDNQPTFDKTQWRRLVEKMRTDFGAPIAPGQVDELATYLSTRNK